MTLKTAPLTPLALAESPTCTSSCSSSSKVSAVSPQQRPAASPAEPPRSPAVFPIFGATTPQIAMLPLVAILTLTAIKDGIEDYRRAALDEEVRAQQPSVARPRSCSLTRSSPPAPVSTPPPPRSTTRPRPSSAAGRTSTSRATRERSSSACWASPTRVRSSSPVSIIQPER